MILTCPNCASRFLLSAQALAPDGRRVKCSSCAEEWFQEPDPDELVDNEEHEIEDIPESVKPIPEGSDLPALPEDVAPEEEAPQTSKMGALVGYASSAVVFLLLFCGFIAMKPAVLNAWPASAILYNMVGADVAAPGEGLVFDQVKARMVSSGQILIEGNIINLTAKTQALPSVEASIRNEAGDTIKETVIHPPYDTLDAETTLPFKSLYSGETESADHVQIRFVLVRDKPEAEPKNDEAGDDNTQAPHADDAAETHDDAAH